MEPDAAPSKAPATDSQIKIDAWRNQAAPFPIATGRSLNIDLANLYLRAGAKGPRELHLALQYSQLETERVPLQARAWFYLGWAKQEAGRPVQEVREAWQRALKLEPNEMVRQRLDQLPP
jgi:hypothetical protein